MAAQQFSIIGATAAALAAMAGSILFAFWRRPLPFVPEDIRRAGAFQMARLAVAFIVVVLVFAGSSYLARNWVWVAFGAVLLASLGFLFTYWLCMAKVYTYRPHPKASIKRVVGGSLTDEAKAIRAERQKTIVALLEESGDNPDLVFERSSVAANQVLIILCVLATMTGGGAALGTLAAVSVAAGQTRPMQVRSSATALPIADPGVAEIKNFDDADLPSLDQGLSFVINESQK